MPPPPSDPDDGGGIIPVTNPHPPMYAYVPTCPGNGPDSVNDGLCGAAVTTCPQPNQTRYWLYVKTWIETSDSYGSWRRQTTPPTLCLGADEVAALDPRLAAIAQVRAQWKTFGLPAATIQIFPSGETLVGAETMFTSSIMPKVTLPPKDILGFRVVLTATATNYRWDFGDGQGLDVNAASALAATRHVYAAPGPKSASLETTYTAEFTLDGNPELYTLPGAAVVPGYRAVVTARQARSQLEAGGR